MKAVFLDYATMGPGLDLQPLQRFFTEFDIHDQTSDAEVADRIRDVEFVFTNKFRMTPAVLEQATKLRFIGLTATGTDNVSLDGAREHGIAVCNIRAYCTRSVTEHVFGVLLMLAHKLPEYSSAVRRGDWQIPFLLITAVFSRITILELQAASGDGAPATARDPLQLQVVVREAVIELYHEGQDEGIRRYTEVYRGVYGSERMFTHVYPVPGAREGVGNVKREAEKLCDRVAIIDQGLIIVMGTHGNGGITDVLIGSTAKRVVRQSTIPVLVIRLPSSS